MVRELNLVQINVLLYYFSMAVKKFPPKHFLFRYTYLPVCCVGSSLFFILLVLIGFKSNLLSLTSI